MRKIFNTKRKPMRHLEFGGGLIVADFYVNKKRRDGNYLHLYSDNRMFDFRICGYPYLYLKTSMEQGDEGEVLSYCAMLWRISQEVYQDPEFSKDIIAAITARDHRLLEEAKKAAEAVTDEQEQTAQTFMEDVAAYADASSDKERKQMLKEWKEEVKDIIKEDGEEV